MSDNMDWDGGESESVDTPIDRTFIEQKSPTGTLRSMLRALPSAALDEPCEALLIVCGTFNSAETFVLNLGVNAEGGKLLALAAAEILERPVNVDAA